MRRQIEAAAFESEVIKIATSKIFFHTIQIMDEGGKYGYKPRGTGILTLINGKYSILTAAHVIDELLQDIIILNSHLGIVKFTNFILRSDYKTGEKIDLAYIELDEELGVFLSKYYTFLPIEKIRHSHVVEENQQYLVFGYPADNLKEEDGIGVTEPTYHLLPGAKQIAYDFHKLSKEFSYALKYAGKGKMLVTGEKVKVDPKPYGLSGSGIWLITAQDIDGVLHYHYGLIGIATSIRMVKYHVLVGNRIEPLMDAIFFNNMKDSHNL